MKSMSVGHRDANNLTPHTTAIIQEDGWIIKFFNTETMPTYCYHQIKNFNSNNNFWRKQPTKQLIALIIIVCIAKSHMFPYGYHVHSPNQTLVDHQVLYCTRSRWYTTKGRCSKYFNINDQYFNHLTFFEHRGMHVTRYNSILSTLWLCVFYVSLPFGACNRWHQIILRRYHNTNKKLEHVYLITP